MVSSSPAAARPPSCESRQDQGSSAGGESRALLHTLLEPYVAGGVGWNGYRSTNAPTASASASPTSANTLSVPLAAGFAVGYKGFIADIRYTVRPTYLQTTHRDAGSVALTNWDFGGMIGTSSDRDRGASAAGAALSLGTRPTDLGGTR